jgi:hypothetical protein
VLGEGDPPVTPFEPSFFSANEVDELINTFSGERVVGRGSAKERSAGQQNLFPGSFRLLVVLLHQSSLGSVKENCGHAYGALQEKSRHTYSST